MRWQDRREQQCGRQAPAGRRGGIPIGGKGRLILLVVVMVAGYYGWTSPCSASRPPRASPSVRTCLSRPGSPRQVHLGDARLHRRCLGRNLPAERQPLSGPQTGALSRRNPYRLRPGPVGDGPFYCPADRTVYIDLSFYQEMRDKLGPMATLPRATWWHTRWATTCRTCSASSARCVNSSRG